MTELTHKTGDRRADLIAFGIMAALTCMVFWQAFAQPDQMLREDAAHFYQPYYEFARAEVLAGRFPLWNPYTKMGVPFHASLQPSLLYPLRWPMFLLPYVSGFIATMMLHYWLTAVAAYLLLRGTMGVGPLGGLAGAVSIAFGGFAMGHMTHTTYWLSYPWFLLCILFVWLAVERRQWAWAIAAGGCVGLMGLVGSVHLFLILGVLLGTYVLYTTIVAAAAAIRTWRRDRALLWKPVVRPAPSRSALVLGGLISAAQMLPAKGLSDRSARSAAPVNEKAQWAYVNRACAHPGRNAVQMVVPFHYGNCRLGYWGEYMYHGSAHYTGVLLLLGAAVSLAYLRRDRKLWFWVVLAGVGFLIGAGENLPVYRILYDTVGLFQKLRNPTRIFWITDIAIAVLGAVGIDRVLAGGLAEAHRSTVRTLAIAAAAGVTLILIGSLVSLAGYAADPDQLVAWVKTQKFAYSMNLRAAAVAPRRVMSDFDLASWGSVAAVVASVAAFVALVLRGKAIKLAGRAVLVVILLGEFVALSFGMVMYEDRWAILKDAPPRAKFLQENLGHQRYAVIPDPPNTWPQNEQVVRARSVQFGIRNTGGKAEGIIDSPPRLRFVRTMRPSGMRSMQDARVWHRRLGTISSASGTKYLLLWQRLSHPVFQLDKLPGGQFRLVRQDDRFRFYENLRPRPMAYFVHRLTSVGSSEEALRELIGGGVVLDDAAVVIGTPPAATANSPARRARVVNVHTVPGRWEIDTETDAPAQLVLLEGYAPGWRCTVAGKPAAILQTNDQVMSVAVGAGTHKVVFDYAPREFRTGIVLSVVGLLVAAALCVVAWRLRRRGTSVASVAAASGPSETPSPSPHPREAKRRKKRK